MTAEEIVKQANSIRHPNAGVRALVAKEFCIMDEDVGYRHNFKRDGGCLDYFRCNRPTFMLSCLQSRCPEDLGGWAIDEYSKAIEGEKYEENQS